MELKNLMIGDWVIVNNSPCKICSINEHCVFTEKGTSYYSMEEIEAIPITTEILEKNGFGFVKSYDIRSVWNGQWIYKGLELATCCFNRDDNWPCFINIDDSNIKCEYVHQLQHALRLCKLDALADNFKI